LKDQGVNEVALVSLAKRNNVAMALKVAREARDILGAAGITNEYSPGRHMANLESVKTYEGTHDIHTLIIGADITGLPAFRSAQKP
jgi:glutaryl-CoA dehydrogenase